MQDFTPARDVSGIYLIAHRDSGKGYIGSSVDIRLRWFNHRSKLRRETHGNPHLQRAWSKHGEDSFVFLIVERVSDLANLRKREQYWLDEWCTYERDTGFNLARQTHGEAERRSPEARAKMSAERKRRGPSDKWRAAMATRVVTDEHRAIAAALGRSTKGRKVKRSTRRKLSVVQQGVLAHSAVLSDAKVVEIMWRLANGETLGSIATEYGVHCATVSDIKHGRTWQHLTVYR